MDCSYAMSLRYLAVGWCSEQSLHPYQIILLGDFGGNLWPWWWSEVASSAGVVNYVGWLPPSVVLPSTLSDDSGVNSPDSLLLLLLELLFSVSSGLGSDLSLTVPGLGADLRSAVGGPESMPGAAPSSPFVSLVAGEPFIGDSR